MIPTQNLLINNNRNNDVENRCSLFKQTDTGSSIHSEKINLQENPAINDTNKVETKENSKIEVFECKNISNQNNINQTDMNFDSKISYQNCSNIKEDPNFTEGVDLSQKISLYNEIPKVDKEEFKENESCYNFKDDKMIDLTSICTIGPGIYEGAFMSKILSLSQNDRCSLLNGMNPSDQRRLIHKNYYKVSSENEQKFAISSDWWRSWCDFVNVKFDTYISCTFTKSIIVPSADQIVGISNTVPKL